MQKTPQSLTHGSQKRFRQFFIGFLSLKRQFLENFCNLIFMIMKNFKLIWTHDSLSKSFL